MTSQSDQFIVELCPPREQNVSFQKFIEQKVKPFTKYTLKFGITSHQSPDSATDGFDLTSNLVKHLRNESQRLGNLDLIVHSTCWDLNRRNISARLKSLKDIGVRKLLLISGEDYKTSISSLNRTQADFYRDSADLINCSIEELKQFESISIAAFPGGNQITTFDDREECARIACKLRILLGLNGLSVAVATQCVFDADTFHTFIQTLSKDYPDIYSRVDVIPSIALFDSIESFDECLRRIKVSKQNVLSAAKFNNFIGKITHLHGQNDMLAKEYCKQYLFSLCRNLIKNMKVTQINVCSFGLHWMASYLIEQFPQRISNQMVT